MTLLVMTLLGAGALAAPPAALAKDATEDPTAKDASREAAPVAPAFRLPCLHGTVSSDSLRGKVVLVDFWASWCPPCRASFSWLSRMQDRFGSKGLQVVAIDLDKSRDPADDFLAKNPVRFTIAYDPDGKTADAFHVKAMPTSFLIDPSGRVIYTHKGFDPKGTAPFEAVLNEACSR
jgi:thiol-disulfide isomerase/thioredoxin